MTKTKTLRRRAALLLAAVAVVGAVAAFTLVAASAEGRTLGGAYCTTSSGSHLCMTIAWDGVDYGTTNRAELSLRPGTYWITVNDDSTAHNFSLRSCPDATSPCGPGTAGSTVEDVTTIPDAPGEVTEKINLEHGTYRLFCSTTGHESRGMYVDFAVGGEGQVG